MQQIIEPDPAALSSTVLSGTGVINRSMVIAASTLVTTGGVQRILSVLIADAVSGAVEADTTTAGHAV